MHLPAAFRILYLPTKLKRKLRDRANRSRSASGPALPTVAGPGFPDKPATTTIVFERATQKKSVTRPPPLPTAVHIRRLLRRAQGISLRSVLLPVLLNVLKDFVRQIQLLVDVARVRIVGVRADRKVLLLLPLKDALALGRIVAPLLDLLHERSGLVLVSVAVLRQPLHQLILLKKVVSNHGECEPTVVADVLAPVQGL